MEKATKKEIYGYYELVKSCIPKNYKKLDVDEIKKRIMEKITSQSIEHSVEMPLKYFKTSSAYLVYAIYEDDPEAEYMLKNVFQKDLPYYFFVYSSMLLKGLVDLTSIDLQKDFKDRLSGFIHQIVSHSYYDKPVFIVGETGTSKELVAEVIHEVSSRSNEPFIPINLVGIPDDLIESVLFGHKKGAFTGAISDREGLLESANEGTVLLDEIGKMPEWAQAKLLRVIERKEIFPVGGKPKKIDVRFIATAHPDDIDKMLPDLKYRLGYPDVILMPTLNERLKVLPKQTIESSLKRVLKKLGLTLKGIPVTLKTLKVNTKVFAMLSQYNYKGNYRELENILHHAIREAHLNDRNEILPEDLGLKFTRISSKDEVTQMTFEDEKTLENIKLKDVINYAKKEGEKVTASLLEKKVNKVLREGKDIKTVLVKDEGLSESNYLTFTRTFKRITGKSLREIKKPI